jgi:hypothetical protein
MKKQFDIFLFDHLIYLSVTFSDSIFTYSGKKDETEHHIVSLCKYKRKDTEGVSLWVLTVGFTQFGFSYNKPIDDQQIA